MSKKLIGLVEKIKDQNIRCFFISPHFDDSVLSCGNLISFLSRNGVKVTVITVFSKASLPPYSPFASYWMNRSGYIDSFQLFEDRKKEENKVANYLNVKSKCLNFIDAAWRKNVNFDFPVSFPKIRNLLLFKYPFKVSDVEIKILDQILFYKIYFRLKFLLLKKNNFLLFFPAGVGNHIDHVILRNIGAKFFSLNSIFYSEYPYNLKRGEIDKSFKKKLKLDRILWDCLKFDNIRKVKAIKYYKSQYNALFPKDISLPKNEKYFIKKVMVNF